MKILQKWAVTVAILLVLTRCDEAIIDANIAYEGS